MEEAVNHLRLSGAKCIFTTLTHLQRAREAAGLCGIEEDRIFLLEMPSQLVAGKKRPEHLVTLDQLIESGSRVRLEKLRFQKGQGARQTAYLCSSSGTSGLPVLSAPHHPRTARGCTDSLLLERCHAFSPQHNYERPSDQHVRGAQSSMVRPTERSQCGVVPRGRACAASIQPVSGNPSLFSRSRFSRCSFPSI